MQSAAGEEPCGEPAISLHSHDVSLIQWTTRLLPVMRDPGSKPREVLMWNRDSPVSVVSLQSLLIILLYLHSKFFSLIFMSIVRLCRQFWILASTRYFYVVTEVRNDTSKCNSVTCYCLCHVLRAITFSNNHGSNFDRAITKGRDKGSSVSSAIMFRSKSFSMLW